jgi:hypothetical protein
VSDICSATFVKKDSYLATPKKDKHLPKVGLRR